MTPEQLLQDLEPLTHADRIRRMVELGRQAPQDAATQTLLAALATRGFYERQLALFACGGSRDAPQVLRALADPSRLIRGLATRLVPLVGDDATVLAALDMVAGAARRLLLAALAGRGRRAVIDRYLDRLAATGDPDLGLLLAYGSAAPVARYGAGVLDMGGTVAWTRLARHHPAQAAQMLAGQAATAGQPDQRLRRHTAAVLPILARRDADAALALLPALLPHNPPTAEALQPLATRRPAQVADLLLASDDRVPVDFSSVAARLGAHRLPALLTTHPDTLPAPIARWLRRLAPADRAQIYAMAGTGWRDGEGVLAPAIVALLPRSVREAEGRRHLALPALQTRPAVRLAYAAFLPWPEARAVVDSALGSPDAELRGAALKGLIGVVRYHRTAAATLLALIHTRRNEQDPVRAAMLEGLAALPPGLWRTEHLADLGAVIRDALDATDLSALTTQYMAQLVQALLPFHPAWAGEWLGTLVRERGYIFLHDLHTRLTDNDVRRLAPVLLPILETWRTPEREHNLLALGQSLGCRLRLFDGLAAILEQTLETTRNPWHARGTLQLLVSYRPAQAATVIPALLARDRSWITQAVVYQYLHRRRQDLLTPFLGRRAYSGLFTTQKRRFVLPLQDGFFRWTAAQQATFATTLGAVTRDTERDSPAVLVAIAQLAALPAVTPDRLMALAAAQNPRPVTRDAALRVLGRLDSGQGVPALLDGLADDRARIAIYALRRAVREMPAPQALVLLRAVPLARVTVAKEVVRLLGEVPGEEAYATLLAFDAQDLQRDVRVALVRALWNHLERQATWPILERAAQSPDPALAAIAGRTPADRLSPAGQARLAGLIAGLLGHPDPKVRLDVLVRCAGMPLSDREGTLLAPLLATLDSGLPDLYAEAARAIFATYSGGAPERLTAATAHLRGNRRALVALVEALETQLFWARAGLLPAARAVLAALAADPLTVTLQVSLAITALPWQEAGALLDQLAHADLLHADALAAAENAILAAAQYRDLTGLADLEAALATRPDVRLRRLAVTALQGQAARPPGWDGPVRARLDRYQADPAPLVAAAAQFIFPPLEEQAPPPTGTADA